MWDSGLKANLQHARARANTHMYSTHASCASLAERQHDYCMQSLHNSTALKGEKRESTDERQCEETEREDGVCGHTCWSAITAENKEKLCHGGAENAVESKIKKEGRLKQRRNTVLSKQAGPRRSGASVRGWRWALSERSWTGIHILIRCLR